MSEQADPSSWLLVEAGWRVVGRDGHDLGEVAEVLGDKAADIFDGIEVRATAFAAPHYIPSEDVTEIRQGIVMIHQASLAEPISEEPPGGLS